MDIQNTEKQIIQQLLIGYIRNNNSLPNNITIDNKLISQEDLAKKYLNDKEIIRNNYYLCDIDTKMIFIKLIINDLDTIFEIFSLQLSFISKKIAKLLLTYYNNNIDIMYKIIKEFLDNDYTNRKVLKNLGCSDVIQQKVDSLITMYSLEEKK